MGGFFIYPDCGDDLVKSGAVKAPGDSDCVMGCEENAA